MEEVMEIAEERLGEVSDLTLLNRRSEGKNVRLSDCGLVGKKVQGEVENSDSARCQFSKLRGQSRTQGAGILNTLLHRRKVVLS